MKSSEIRAQESVFSISSVDHFYAARWEDNQREQAIYGTTVQPTPKWSNTKYVSLLVDFLGT